MSLFPSKRRERGRPASPRDRKRPDAMPQDRVAEDQAGAVWVVKDRAGEDNTAEAASTGTVHESGVRGERGAPTISRAPSIQSRLSSALAAALMIALGVGLLAWYYSNAIVRQTRARHSAQAAAAQRAQGEMPLPALGPIAMPWMRPPAESSADQHLETDVSQDSATVASLDATPLQVSRGRPGAWVDSGLAFASGCTAPVGQPAYAPGACAANSPAQQALQRRLSGPSFAGSAPSAAAIPAPGDPVAMHTPAEHSRLQGHAQDATLPAQGSMAARLQPTPTVPAQAQLLPSRGLLLPKGAFIDCTLETAIDSTLPGMTTCITASDTFGADGQVVLLERGTKLVGETRGQVRHGAARLFVLWTQARTPSGILVPLDSPGTDALGRSGLPGEVRRHFWERFGAAILISTIDGAVQAAVQSASDGGGTVIYSPSGSREVLTEVLETTVAIPPTIVVPHGERIQVLVARDLDFRSVYELRGAEGQRQGAAAAPAGPDDVPIPPRLTARGRGAPQTAVAAGLTPAARTLGAGAR